MRVYYIEDILLFCLPKWDLKTAYTVMSEVKTQLSCIVGYTQFYDHQTIKRVQFMNLHLTWTTSSKPLVVTFAIK